MSQSYRNPVIPGDHPDPSIIRVGKQYWATSTTSEWAPIFPLLRSDDLVNWRVAGSIFPSAPAWSRGSYWAPELSEYQGRFFLYYAARNHQGILCVAVATSDNMEHPFHDHGPLICQEDGSIDPVTAIDEHGRRCLIWKEDGNSRHLHTPIWAQPLSPDGTKLTGIRTQLITNDAPWEGPVVEGPFIVKRDGFFYLFYAGAGCCGINCDYKVGVARAKNLLGPWQKNPGNPIVSSNDSWRCPGHGSIVADPSGREFFLYHSYPQVGFFFVGREAMLDEIVWDQDGWPHVNRGSGPSVSAASPLGAPQKPQPIIDDFDCATLSLNWQWSWRNPPIVSVRGDGNLHLRPRKQESNDMLGGVLAQVVPSPHYRASVDLVTSSLTGDMTAGLSGYGQPHDAIGIAYKQNAVFVFRRRDNKTLETARAAVPSANILHLKIEVKQGNDYQFWFAADDGPWRELQERVAGADLPPWDLAVRAALICGGLPNKDAVFRHFRLENLNRNS